jgi:hypothetical protein
VAADRCGRTVGPGPGRRWRWLLARPRGGLRWPGWRLCRRAVQDPYQDQLRLSGIGAGRGSRGAGHRALGAGPGLVRARDTGAGGAGLADVAAAEGGQAGGGQDDGDGG